MRGGSDWRAVGNSRPGLVRRLIALTDLTSLNESDDVASVQALSEFAASAPVKPAALCIWARLIPAALEALRGSAIPVCAVANFPEGAGGTAATVAETAAAVALGASEIDVVFPYRALLGGDLNAGYDLVRGTRDACGKRALLKVILETGQLDGTENIRRAAGIAIDGGAQFLKTSTGKTQPGATLEAAAVLIDVIAAASDSPSVGLKLSGGIRSIDDAAAYLSLFEERFGAGSASRANFRIGASGLFKELLAAIDV